MNIKPNTMTITQLLSSRCQFMIPRFQREYSWEKDNYKEFMDDMIGCLKVDNGKIEDTSYFLGTMLFVGNLEMAGRTLDVVDGQQRLTIITILFSAISDHFRELGNEILSKRIFQYIMTEDDNGKSVRILQSKTHYPFFSYFIQDIEKSAKQEATSEEEVCIQETYEYLYDRTGEKKLRKALCDTYGKKLVDSVNYEDILKALRDQVLKSFVVTISTEEREDANAIFEILNAKGKRLANVDLIKNQIFSVCNTTEPADFAEITWNKIKKNLYSGDEAIGMATFFRHYWISKYSASSEKKLYDNFKRKVTPAVEKTYKDFLSDMEKNSRFYMKITNPSRADYGNRKEYFWLVQSLDYLSNKFNIVQTRIALMAVLEKKEEEILTAKKLKSLIQYLEGFHFAYNAMLAKRPNVLDSRYATFARRLRECKTKEECNRCIDDLIKTLDKLYPTFEEFKKNFLQLSYSKKDAPDNIKVKYIINKMECFFSSDKHEVFDDNGSIEHILPEERGNAALNIGNLILLEYPLNHDADKMEYETKKSIYLKSQYSWIAEFVSQYRTWSVEAIPQRAETMADVYYHKILNRS